MHLNTIYEALIGIEVLFSLHSNVLVYFLVSNILVLYANRKKFVPRQLLYRTDETSGTN